MFFITVAVVAIKLIADGGTDFPPLAWLVVVAASGLMLVGHTLLYRNRPAGSHLHSPVDIAPGPAGPLRQSMRVLKRNQ